MALEPPPPEFSQLKGAKLVLGARRGELLEELTEEISANGGEAAFLAGNVEDANYSEALVALAETRFGGLDGAFNNAGIIGDMGPVPRHGSQQLA